MDNYSLRCSACNFVFEKELKVSDNISDLKCPNCGAKYRVELNLGVRPKSAEEEEIENEEGE